MEKDGEKSIFLEKMQKFAINSKLYQQSTSSKGTYSLLEGICIFQAQGHVLLCQGNIYV